MDGRPTGRNRVRSANITHRSKQLTMAHIPFRSNAQHTREVARAMLCIGGDDQSTLRTGRAGRPKTIRERGTYKPPVNDVIMIGSAGKPRRSGSTS